MQAIVVPVCETASPNDRLPDPNVWASIQRQHPATGLSVGQMWDAALERILELQSPPMDLITYNALAAVFNDLDSGLTQYVRAWEAFDESNSDEWANHLRLVAYTCGSALGSNYIMSTRDL
ncbi:MAG: hypothetical protein R6W79_04565 [Acidimicrobiia bacterium]